MVAGVTNVQARSAVPGASSGGIQPRPIIHGSNPSYTLTLTNLDSDCRPETVVAELWLASAAGKAPTWEAIKQVRTEDLLVADLDAANVVWLSVADIIIQKDTGLAGDLSAWRGHVFDDYPGCMVEAAGYKDRSHVVSLRDGWLIRFRLETGTGYMLSSETAVCATIVHFWLVAGWPIEALNAASLVFASPREAASSRLRIAAFLPPVARQAETRERIRELPGERGPGVPAVPQRP
jgi:hypothetical protein